MALCVTAGRRLLRPLLTARPISTSSFSAAGDDSRRLDQPKDVTEVRKARSKAMMEETTFVDESHL